MNLNKYAKLLGFCLLSGGHALQAQNCGEVGLNDARKKYESGNFDEVVSILTPCLDYGFTEKERIQAYRLLAITHLANDHLGKADTAVTQMLKYDPNYEPNLFDPPRFAALIGDMKTANSRVLVTSVSKKKEDIRVTPATVAIITQEDIRQRGYIDLEAFFSDLPGFDVSRTFGTTYSNIYQRGYRSNNTERTLFLIDGVEENSLWSNIAYISRQYPISNVKRVEIIYGPASTMYGANALVGVVNVITKDPDEGTRPVSVYASTGYGTYNTQYLDLSVAGKYKNMSASVTVRKFGSDERDLSGFPDFDYNPADYDKVDYKKLLSSSGSGAAAFAKRYNIPANGDYFTIQRNANGDTTAVLLTDAGQEAARNADKKGVSGDVNGKPLKYSNTSQNWLIYGKVKISDFTLGYQVWKYEQANINYFNDNNEAGANNNSIWAPRESFAYAKYDKQITDNLSVMNLTQYRITEIADNSTAVYLNNYSNRALNAGSLLQNRAANWVTEYYYQISRQFRNETKINYNPTKDIDIVGGVEVRNSSVQGDYRKAAGPDVLEKGKSTGDTYPGGNDFTIYDLGVYAQAKYKYEELVQFVFGGRYDNNQIRNTGGYGGQFNPRLALIGTPGNAIIKVIYARAFQNASNWTKFATNPSRQLANPTLEPEKVQNVDVSAGYKLSKDLYIDAVGYYSSYKGVVGTAIVPFGSTTTQQNQAIGALKIIGLQSNLTWKHGNWNVYANYTYTNPKNNIIKDGKLTNDYQKIGDISKHHVNAGVNYILKEHWNFNLRANWIDKRPVGAGTTVGGNPGNFPSVLLLNGAISYNELLKGLDVQLICNNITNLEYSDPGIRSADGALYGYRVPQRERNLMIRLTYDLH